MTLEKLENEMREALKAGNKVRRTVIGEMVTAVQKASTSGKKRVEITENLVDETLQKVQKTYQEMVDTCPAERAELLEDYKTQLEIVKEFAPQLVTDEAVIMEMITKAMSATGLAMTKKNRGAIMKVVAPAVKGKADMKVVNKLVGEMLV